MRLALGAIERAKNSHAVFSEGFGFLAFFSFHVDKLFGVDWRDRQKNRKIQRQRNEMKW